jgi:WD40 repeat protein
MDGLSSRVKCLALSPDGEWLAAGDDEGQVQLFAANTGARRSLVAAHTNTVYGLAFSADSQRLASASFDRSIKLWAISNS